MGLWRASSQEHDYSYRPDNTSSSKDLDWVPANHAQAEDCCYPRLGQTKRVTVEYFHAEGSLDGYIARLLEAKIALINAVEAEDFPDASIIAQFAVDLRRLAPALIEEVHLTRAATSSPFVTVQRLAAAKPRPVTPTPIEETGIWEFESERDRTQSYRVTYGRAGHLECTCKGSSSTDASTSARSGVNLRRDGNREDLAVFNHRRVL